MKKFLLIIAVLSAISSYADDAPVYKVVGNFTGWATENAPELTGTDQTALTCTIENENLTSGFKIVDTSQIIDGKWGDQWGLANEGDVISLNKATPLTGVVDGVAPTDINLSNQISSLTNATITFDATTYTLTVTGTPNYTHAPEEGWVIVGTYTDKPGDGAGQTAWETENATSLTGDANSVSGFVMNLTSGFKIINVSEIDENGEWGDQWGYNDPISIGQTVTLTSDGEDITFADNLDAVKFAKVTFNPTTHALTVEAGYFPTLYVCGINGWDQPGTGNSIEMTFYETTQLYSAAVSWQSENDTYPSFKLFSENWTNEIGGATSGVVVGTDEAVSVSLFSSSLTPSDLTVSSDMTAGTEYTLYFNPITMKMVFNNEDLVKTSIPAYEAVSSIGDDTLYIYGPAYGENPSLSFAYSGSPAPTATIVQTEGPAATADGDSGSNLDVILFSNFTSGATAAIDNMDLEVTGATEVLVAIYSATPGKINVYGIWRYAGATAMPETPYVIEISESQTGEWQNYYPTAKEIGYGAKDPNYPKYGGIGNISEFVFEGTGDIIPQFAVAAIAFPSTTPLGVENVETSTSTTATVFNLQGIAVKTGVSTANALEGLPEGIYIVNGHKVFWKGN